MSIKQIIGGYIPGTKSCRNHSIKNINIKPDGWKEFTLEVNGKTFQFENINKELNIEINYNNSYKMGLYINDKEIYQYPYLFNYTIIFNGDFNENCITYKDGNIYDS